MIYKKIFVNYFIRSYLNVLYRMLLDVYLASIKVVIKPW